DLMKHPQYNVGDRLLQKWRGLGWTGTVTEAKGTFHRDGHVLYRLSVPMEPEPMSLLVREEDVGRPDALHDLAHDIDSLLQSPQIRERFRVRCVEYLRARKLNKTRRPP